MAQTRRDSSFGADLYVNDAKRRQVPATRIRAAEFYASLAAQLHVLNQAAIRAE